MRISLRNKIILFIFPILFIPVNAQSSTEIVDVRYGKQTDYSRIVLEFDKDIQADLIKNKEDNLLTFRIPDTLFPGREMDIPDDPLIEKISWKTFNEKDLLLSLKTKTNETEVKHFSLKSPPRLVIDIRQLDIKKDKVTFQEEKKVRLSKIDSHVKTFLPDDATKMTKTEKREDKGEQKKKTRLSKIYSHVETFIPDDSSKKAKLEKTGDETEKEGGEGEQKGVDSADQEYKKAIALYKRRQFREALSKFIFVKEHFPDSKYREASFFFIGDCHFHMAESNSNVKYWDAINAYKNALMAFPESKFVPKALFQLGRCYLEMKFFYEAESLFQQVIDEHPKSEYASKAQLGKGINLYQYDRFAEAVIEFQKTIKKYPNTKVSWEALYRLGDAYFKNKEFKKARKNYEEARKIWPVFLTFHEQTFFNMGENYFQDKDYDNAIQTFFRVANIEPRKEISQKALARVGDCFEKKGMTKEALMIYSQIIKDFKKGEGVILSKIRMADIGAKKEEVDAKRFVFDTRLIFDYYPYIHPDKTYTEIYDKFPKSSLADLALFKEGNFLIREKKLREGIERMKLLLQRYPESILVDDTLLILRSSLKNLIVFYYRQGRYYSVVKTFNENYKPYLSEVKDSQLFFLVGRSYREIGVYGRALVMLSRALELAKKNTTKDHILFEIAELYSQYGNTDKADKTYRFFLQKYPRSQYLTEAMHSLGDTLYKKGNFKNASVIYSSAIKRDKNNKRNAISYYFLGNSYKELKKYPQAIKAYRISSLKLREIRHKRPEINNYIRDQYFNLGEVLFLNQEYKQALDVLEEAVKLYPKNERIGWALYTKGMILMKMKREEEAIKVFESVKSKFKDNIWAQMSDESIKDYHFQNLYRSYLKKG